MVKVDAMPYLRQLVFIFLVFSESSVALKFRLHRNHGWTGRWFPFEPTSIPNSIQENRNYKVDHLMDAVNPHCDDAKTNITIDWNGSFEDYTCLNPRSRYIPNPLVDSLIEFENIPKAYKAPHFCMNQSIEYDSPLPTFGAHRPLWPVYGEYKYLPKQRWLHSLEHGAIVALYHPCADLRQISLLKKLVRSCLRRYIITPYRHLLGRRPLALLAWGVSFTMSTIYPNAVRQFIQEQALKAPEEISDNGQYSAYLLRKSKIVSDIKDSQLCPEP